MRGCAALAFCVFTAIGRASVPIVAIAEQQPVTIPWIVWLDEATGRIARTPGGPSLGPSWKVDTLNMFGTAVKSVLWSAGSTDAFAYYDAVDLGGPRPLGNTSSIRMQLSAVSGSARPQAQVDTALAGRWETDTRQYLMLNSDGTASGEGAAYWGSVDGAVLLVDATARPDGWRWVRTLSLSSDKATLEGGFRKR